MRLSVRKVNGINIALLIVSALVAFRFPLETFLGAYAFLGPLHYLTEISWLEQKRYFLPSKQWILGLVCLCAFVFPLGYLFVKVATVSMVAVTIAFLGTGLFLYAKQQKTAWLFLFVGSVALITAFYASLTVLRSVELVAVLLPTLVHVSLFTGLFMLSGALREKGWKDLGFVTFGLFVLCAIGLFVSGAWVPSWGASAAARPLYSAFYGVNETVLRWFTSDVPMSVRLFDSALGLGLMRFIAFAYLYHYLNWFSKTSIIQWHAVSKRRVVAILCMWIITIGVYLVDYRVGFLALYFLSLLHVFLEFPLNWKTLTQLPGLVKQRFGVSLSKTTA